MNRQSEKQRPSQSRQWRLSVMFLFLASLNRRSENVVTEAVIVAELELGDRTF